MVQETLKEAKKLEQCQKEVAMIKVHEKNKSIASKRKQVKQKFETLNAQKREFMEDLIQQSGNAKENKKLFETQRKWELINRIKDKEEVSIQN